MNVACDKSGELIFAFVFCRYSVPSKLVEFHQLPYHCSTEYFLKKQTIKSLNSKHSAWKIFSTLGSAADRARGVNFKEHLSLVFRHVYSQLTLNLAYEPL